MYIIVHHLSNTKEVQIIDDPHLYATQSFVLLHSSDKENIHMLPYSNMVFLFFSQNVEGENHEKAVDLLKAAQGIFNAFFHQ